MQQFPAPEEEPGNPKDASSATLGKALLSCSEMGRDSLPGGSTGPYLLPKKPRQQLLKFETAMSLVSAQKETQPQTQKEGNREVGVLWSIGNAWDTRRSPGAASCPPYNKTRALP